MRMGNFRGLRLLRLPEMSTRRPPVGIDHPTVVPTNAEESRLSREPDESELDVDLEGTGEGRADERSEPAVLEP